MAIAAEPSEGSVDADAPEYSIEELAELTGVPTRTIRYYQSKGTLVAPERRGRVAVYTGTHVERLRVIAELQSRGLRLDAIRDVLALASDGETTLQDWLGVGERLQSSWTDDRPAVLTHAELEERIGPGRPAFITDALRFGLIRREGNALPATYLVYSLNLFDIALRLERAGIDLTIASGAEGILRKRIGKAADDLVEWFTGNLGKGVAGSGDANAVADAFEVMQPLAVEAAQLIFAQEMERALRTFVEKGGMVGQARKAAKSKG